MLEEMPYRISQWKPKNPSLKKNEETLFLWEKGYKIFIKLLILTQF